MALLGIGIYAKVGKSDYIDLTDELSSASEYVTAGNLLIAVGVIIVVVAFFGCCGAVTENACMVLIVRDTTKPRVEKFFFLYEILSRWFKGARKNLEKILQEFSPRTFLVH